MPPVSRSFQSAQLAGELGTRPDRELRVDVREVALDGLLAEVQRGGDLAVRAAFGHERRDPELRRGEPVLARPPADPTELGARALDPARGAERLELGQRRLERPARGAPLA